MLLNLDTYAGRVCPQHDFGTPITRLEIALGAAAPQVRLQNGNISASATDPVVAGRIEFAAAVDYGDTPVVSGFASISLAVDAADTQDLSLSEDYANSLLVALFAANPSYVDLIAGYRWRSGAEAAAGSAYHFSQRFTLRVLNTIIPSTYIPGAATVGGQIYLSTIDDYTGGAATDLDGLATTALPLLTVVRIVTANGESAWQLKTGTAATDAAGGIIRPTDYHVTTNPRNWIRVSGY